MFIARPKIIKLGDLRIRNANGELLSYAWLNSSQRVDEQLNCQSVGGDFPLPPREADRAQTTQLEVIQSSDGSLRWRSESRATTVQRKG